LGGGTTPFLIIYFVPLHRVYIRMLPFPKLGLFLSQNFGGSYLSQIKFILKMKEYYLIALKKIFSTV
jgi:hypothetical protein